MENIFSGAESYAGAQVAKAPLLTEPFEHCIVDDVLPAEVFDAIHENWPSDDILKSLPELGRTKGYQERFVMLMQQEFLDQLPEHQRDVWLAVMRVVMGQDVVLALVEKFRNILVPRIAHLPKDINLNPEMLVVSDRTDYAIGPHTDTKFRFISLLYYLSRDPEYASYGTGLYVPKDPRHEFPHNAHVNFEMFNRHTLVDYKPNRLLAFPRSDKSFHGVEPVPVENCDRRLIIVNVKAPEGSR